MRRLTILQLGDIHYASPAAHAFGADVKDRALAARFVDAVSPSPLQAVVAEIQNVVAREDISALLFCGDLTDYGKLPEYRECVQYLCDALELSERKCVHVVAGNHDVDRQLCDPESPDLFSKFAPLVDAWSDAGVPVLSSRLRPTTIEKNGVSALILSMNSCVGCGEFRNLPEEVEAAIRKAVEPYLKDSKIDADAFRLIGEQLDAPAFHEEHIRMAESRIGSTESETIAFVLAHHPVLPQSRPRLSLYGEVVNAGMVRSRTSTNGVPVVYCHGHIHDDPIEVVATPEREEGLLISIAAPLLTAGFNEIDVFFGRDKRALGVAVRRFRMQNHGGVRAEPEIRVGLRPARNPLEEFLKSVVSCTTDEPKRFGDVVKEVTVQTGKKHRDRTVADALLEAEWLGLVSITDRYEDTRYWTVERIGP